MTQPVYTPRFPVRGCRRPSRLHHLYRLGLNAVCIVFVAVVLWLALGIVILGA